MSPVRFLFVVQCEAVKKNLGTLPVTETMKSLQLDEAALLQNLFCRPALPILINKVLSSIVTVLLIMFLKVSQNTGVKYKYLCSHLKSQNKKTFQ